MFTNDPKPSDIGRRGGSFANSRWTAPASTKGDKPIGLSKSSIKRLPAVDFSKQPQAESELDSATIGRAMTGPSDPRWVMAIRTASVMQGAILPPQNREKLIKLGKILNLSPFDTNLIIAIIQDQARRGYQPQYCPTAGEPQLRMIALPRHSDPATSRSRRALYIALAITAIVGLELIALWMIIP